MPITHEEQTRRDQGLPVIWTEVACCDTFDAKPKRRPLAIESDHRSQNGLPLIQFGGRDI